MDACIWCAYAAPTFIVKSFMWVIFWLYTAYFKPECGIYIKTDIPLWKYTYSDGCQKEGFKKETKMYSILSNMSLASSETVGVAHADVT